jgi:hypothetical protein
VACAPFVLVVVCPFIMALYLFFGFESNLEGLIIEFEAVRRYGQIDRALDASKVLRKSTREREKSQAEVLALNATLDLSDDEGTEDTRAVERAGKKKKQKKKMTGNGDNANTLSQLPGQIPEFIAPAPAVSAMGASLKVDAPVSAVASDAITGTAGESIADTTIATAADKRTRYILWHMCVCVCETVCVCL